MRRAGLCAVLALLAAVGVVAPAGSAAAATVIRVPANQPTIQAAITASVDGDTILVAPGTYTGSVNFGGKDVEVRAEQGPTLTTIDAGGAAHAVVFAGAEGRQAILRGFRVTGAINGGISVDSSSPTIADNIIENNTTCGDGGGIIADLVVGAHRGQHHPEQLAARLHGWRRGRRHRRARSGLDRDRAQHHRRQQHGFLQRRDRAVRRRYAHVRSNTIRGNHGSTGGGISIVNHSDALIVGNLVVDNVATGSGGGISWLTPAGTRGPLVLHNTVARNDGSDGDAIHADGYDAAAVAAGNALVAVDSSAVTCGTFNDVNPPQFRSNLAYAPTGAAYVGCNPTGVNGNIVAAPAFVDGTSAAGNFRPAAGSPLVDAGPQPPDASVGSTDLGGSPRVVDGNGDAVARIDIGAYEKAPAQPSAITFVGQAMSNANSTAHAVTVPGAVVAGDGLLLFLALNTTATITDPAGWTPLDTVTTGSSRVRVWRRVATASDAGAAVRASVSAISKGNFVVAAYRGTSTVDPVGAFARAAELSTTATHTTPSAAVAPGAWGVSYWTHKDSTTTALTPPAGVTVRAAGTQTGSGRVVGLLADSGGVVPGSSYGGLVATAASASNNASMWTLMLRPGTAPPPPNQLPDAVIAASCSALTCSVSGDGSTDADGSIVSYRWNFGDGTTATGMSASHAYATAGTRTVTLTVVDDDGGSDQASRSVTAVQPTLPRVTSVGTAYPFGDDRGFDQPHVNWGSYAQSASWWVQDEGTAFWNGERTAPIDYSSIGPWPQSYRAIACPTGCAEPPDVTVPKGTATAPWAIGRVVPADPARGRLGSPSRRRRGAAADVGTGDRVPRRPHRRLRLRHLPQRRLHRVAA